MYAPRAMDWREILIEASQNVKVVVTSSLDSPRAAEFFGRGAGGDEKRWIDLQAEKALVDTLRKHDVDFTLISEESGFQEYGTNPIIYVTADPIDGTANLLRGLPFACTSIALSKAPNLDSVHAAVVTDLFHDSTYVAQKNQGAFQNYQKISPAQTDSLYEAIVGVDLNSGSATNKGKLISFLHQTTHFRHLGANALELCYVADGKTDAFIDLRGTLRTTDVAAATLIIREAGAIITTPSNNHFENSLSPFEKISFIASGNTQIHQSIVDHLRKSKVC